MLLFFSVFGYQSEKSAEDSNEFNVDYESSATRKSYSDRSDKKRTSKFIAGFQAMFDNNLSKSIRSIAIAAHEVIRYFLYKMRKGQFLSEVVEYKRKDRVIKLLKELKYPFQLNML